MAVKEKNKFDKWNDWLNNMEGSAVNFAATIVPWLTPLSPMVMTFNHAIGIFGGGTWGIIWAIPVAATVELSGLATVSTMIRFWMHNQRKNLAAYKKAPTWVAGIMFAFYLALVLTTNVLLDLGPVLGIRKEYVEIVVKALFTLQTVPGAVLVAVRHAHKELLEGNSIFTPTSTSTSASTSNPTPAPAPVPVPAPTPAPTKKKTVARKRNAKQEIYDFIVDFKQKHGGIPSFTQTVTEMKLPPTTVSRWRNQWITENP